MNPAATLDDTMTLRAVDPAPATAEVLRRTWPVTDGVHARVQAGVAGTYRAWGVARPVADLLGQLAAYYVDDALKRRPTSPHIAVTAMIEGSRATVSVSPAQHPEPAQGAPLPNPPRAAIEPSWGRTTLTEGPCLYAGVNLISVRAEASR